VASDLSWGYRTQPTRMSGKRRRGGGVCEGVIAAITLGGNGVAQTLRFTGMTAVEVLGSVDELADGTAGSEDAATGAAIGPYRKSRVGAPR
jgi:hypothetical protein